MTQTLPSQLLAIEPSPESIPAAETSAAPTKEFYESMAKMEMAHEIAVNADYRLVQVHS